MMVAAPELPSQGDGGGRGETQADGKHRTGLPEVIQACRKLFKCGCKKWFS